jgi:CRP/FNR family transcriptional regulator, cyclic AMP receptor protein
MSDSRSTSIAPWAGTAFGELANEGSVLSFPKKSILITEGDEGNSLYLILSGRVKVYASDTSGKELVICTCEAGDILGEMTLDGGPRSASVVALEPTRCAVIPMRRLKERLQQDPDLAIELIQLLIRRNRRVTAKARDLALANVYSRIAHLLTGLAIQDASGHMVVSERLSQQDIADRVGSSRDMVNRVFKELVKGGYLEVDRRSIILRKKLPADW